MSEVGNLSVKIGMDSAQFERSVASLNRSLLAMGQELKGIQNKGKEWGNSIDGLKAKQTSYAKILDTQKEKIAQLTKQHEEAKNTEGEHALKTERLAVQLARANAEMTKTESELEAITAELRRQEAELANSQSNWNKFGEAAKQAGEKLKAVGENMTNIGKELSMKVTAPLTALGVGAAKAAIDFESAFAGVRKTVNTSEEGFKKLERGILDMARTLPASASEIAGVAESAGQLGIAEENILGFTRTIIDLGESTNLTLEQASSEFARFANITGMSQDNFDRLGSTVVALGNSMATTEAEIVSMGMRLAGQGAQVGLTESQIMALSATMSSLGIQAEAGGTAMSTILKKIQLATGEGGKSLERFAKAAGMSSTEFKQAFETDAAGALDSFIKGLAKSGESGENLSAILADLGIKGQYEQDTLLRLAGASDLLGQALDTSASAWTENSALSDEAAQRYETTASQLAMLKNRIVEVGISFGSVLLPFLIQIVDTLSPIITKFTEIDSSMQLFIMAIAGIAAAIGPVLIVVGMLVSSVGTITSAFGAISLAIANAGGIMAILSGAMSSLGSVFAALTGPIGLAIAAIVAIGAGLVIAYNKVDWFREGVNNLLSSIWEIIKSTFNAIKEFIVNIWTQITSFWEENGEQIKQATINVWTAIKAVINALMPVISAIIKTAMLVIEVIIEQVWNAVKGVIQGALDVILGLIKTFSSLFTGDWKGLWEGIKQLVSGAVVLIWNTMQLMFFGRLLGGLKTFALGFTKSFTSLWTTIKSLFSSSIEFIKNVFTAGFNVIKNVATLSMNGIKTNISTVWNTIKSIFTTTINSIKSVINLGFSGMVSTVKTMMSNIVKAVTDKATSMLQAGKDLVQGLINGILNMGAAAIDAMAGVVNGVVNKAKSMLGIKSPSRVFMQIGKWLSEGWAIGIKTTGNQVVDAVSDIALNTKDIAEHYAQEEVKLRNNMNSEIAKIQKRSAEDVAKIQNNAWAKKRSTTEQENIKIRRIQEDADKKIKALKAKTTKEIVELESKMYKDILSETQQYINDKKSLDQLTLIDEAQIWEQTMLLFKEGSAERIKAQQEYKKAVDAVNNEIVSINQSYQQQMQKINDDLIKQEQDLNKAYDDALAQRKSSLMSFAGTFDEFSVEVKQSGYELLNNLQSQVDGFKQWQSEFAKLSERDIDATLLSELSGLGVKALPQLLALNQLTDEQLTQYSALYQEKSQLAREQAESELIGMKEDTDKQILALRESADKQLDKLQVEWDLKIKALTRTTANELSSLQQIGVDAGQGLLDGLASMEGPLIDKAKEIADAIRETIQSALDINSPSRVMRGFGVNIGEGLVLGMDDMLSKVAAASRRLAASVEGNASVNGGGQTSYDYSRKMTNHFTISTRDNGVRDIDRMMRRLAYEF